MSYYIFIVNKIYIKQKIKLNYLEHLKQASI